MQLGPDSSWESDRAAWHDVYIYILLASLGILSTMTIRDLVVLCCLREALVSLLVNLMACSAYASICLELVQSS